MNFNQLKLKVYDTNEKDEKISASFKPIDDSYVINKDFLDEKLSKIDGHFSYIEKDYNGFEILSNKLSFEEILVQTASKTTIQILQDEGLFDNYNSAYKIIKNVLFTRRRPDLKEVNDVVQWFCSRR